MKRPLKINPNNYGGIFAAIKKVVGDNSLTKQGVVCLCCEQLAKVYRRKFPAEAAYGMIRLRNLMFAYEVGEYFHITDIIDGFGKRGGGGDFAKAVYWGLIEAMLNNDERKRTSGYWRLTQKGLWFVLNDGGITIPSHVFVYNGEALGFDQNNQINIRHALGDKFNYSELMNEVISL